MKNCFLFGLISACTLIVGVNQAAAQWNSIPALQGTNIYCFLTTNDSVVFVGGDNMTLLRSTDGGSSWTSVMHNGIEIDTILSLGQGLGYIFAGANGGVYRSSDEGDLWTSADSGLPVPAKMNGFAFVDTIFFVASDMGIYSSADSGRYWKADTAGLSLGQLFPGGTGGLAGIVAVGSKLYTIKSFYGGNVYETSSDSIAWTQINSEYYNGGYAIAAIDTNIFIATLKGIYLHAGGTNWLPRNNGLPVNDSTYFMSCILATSDSLLFADIGTSTSATTGIYVTSDLGETWTPVVDTTFTGIPVNAMVANNDYLFAGTGNGGWRIPIGDVVTSVNDDRPTLPSGYALSQNFPNPFNPTTNIEYRIVNFGFVSLKVYDVLGREVATLVNKVERPGSYQVQFDGSKLASGVYFYRLISGKQAITRKMILMK